MKHLFSIVFAFILTLSGAYTVSAQEVTVTSDTSVDSSTSVTNEPIKMAPVREDLRAQAEQDKKRMEALRLELENKKNTVREIASSTRAEVMETRAGIIEKRDEIREQAIEKRDEMRQLASTTRADIAEKREEMKAEVKERLINNLSEKIKKTSEHLVKMVERLYEIAGKIETRINKIKENGKDVSLSERALADAKVKIGSADFSAKAVAEITVSSEEPRESLAELKTAVETTRTAMKSAHEALVLVITGLKNSLTPVATTSATSSASE